MKRFYPKHFYILVNGGDIVDSFYLFSDAWIHAALNYSKSESVILGPFGEYWKVRPQL